MFGVLFIIRCPLRAALHMSYVNLDSNSRFMKGATVLGTFTLSYETTPHGLQFFGDVKILIVLEAPVALFPQPTFAE